MRDERRSNECNFNAKQTVRDSLSSAFAFARSLRTNEKNNAEVTAAIAGNSVLTRIIFPLYL